MGARVVSWREDKSPLEFFLGLRDIPVVDGGQHGEFCVSFGEGIVQRDGLERRGLGTGKSAGVAKHSSIVICHSDACPSACAGGLGLYHLVKISFGVLEIGNGGFT